MNLKVALASLLLVGCSKSGTPPPDPPEPGSGEWLTRAEETLVKAATAEWAIELDVFKGIEGLEAGRHDYVFEVQGPHRVHWKEKHTVSGQESVAENWYDGETLYVRRGSDERLEMFRMGDDEGDCVRLSMARGGLVGWMLVHATPLGGLTAERPQIVRFEMFGGRECAVVEYDMTIGGVCGRHENLPGCKVWIDRERLHVLKREYALTLKLGDEEVPFSGVETYRRWKLNSPIAGEVFRTKGMKETPLRATLPEDPEAYELAMTDRLMGIRLQTIPSAKGGDAIRDLDETALPELKLRAEKLVDLESPDAAKDAGGVPAPAHDRPMRNAVARRTSAGTYLEAWDGVHSDLEIERPSWIPTESFENRRHRYQGIGGYVGFSIYIGPVEGTRMKPILAFRDPGFQSHGPIDMVIDRENRCHVVFADKDVSQDDRLKILYVVGDLTGHVWKEGWVLSHDPQGGNCSGLAIAGDDKNLWMAWSHTPGGVYVLAMTPDGFSPPVRIHRGPAEQVAMAREAGGTLLVAWTVDGGEKGQAMVRRRQADGTWSRSLSFEVGYVSSLEEIGLFPLEGGGALLRRYQYKSGMRKNGLFQEVNQWTLKP